MDILAAIKREEKKLEKQMSELQHKLKGFVPPQEHWDTPLLSK